MTVDKVCGAGQELSNSSELAFGLGAGLSATPKLFAGSPKRHRFAKLDAEWRASLANVQRFVNHNYQLAECWRSAGVAAMKKKIVIGLLLLVIGALGVGAYMMHSMMQRGFSTRVEPTSMEKALAKTIRERAIPSRYNTMKNPVVATPEVLHEGMAHWADLCTACHANNGSGDTMSGKAMYPRPPDMRQKDTQEMSDGELYYTIKNGVRLSGMPAFGDPGDDDVDRWKLVAFIRHLPQLSDAEETEMQHLNPKSPEEIREQKEEEEFLKGDAQSATPATTMHHH